jgi:hypothetical protein
MAQRDYLLRMFEEMSRALAQVIYHKELKDYYASHALIDEQFKQALGMGSDFTRSLSDETLLAMLTTLGTLNVEKCWLVAILLKAEGDLFAEEQDESNSYYSYLKACNLFLEALFAKNRSKEIEQVSEVEELLPKLEDYELPLRTRQLLFWYFDYTNQYGRAEDVFFDILALVPGEEMDNEEEAQNIREKGEAFYARLLGKSDETLQAGNFSRAEIGEGLARIHKHFS